MTTVFGLSELRSKLDDWRSNWKIAPGTEPENAESDGQEQREEGKNSHAANDLSLLIQNLVIPKLIADSQDPDRSVTELLASQSLSLDSSNNSNKVHEISSDDVEDFTQLSVKADARALMEFVDQHISDGSSIDSVFVDLLAPSARRLGEYWDDDQGDFVDVTMGLWRIQEILRELTLRFPPPAVAGFGQRSALFSTMPGEQHSLGTLMIAECFYRAGWDTDILIEPTQSELIGKFANRHYDLIGLTISRDCPRATLANLVNAIRSVSSNPGAQIMMGGRLINEKPELVEQCGADATAKDAPGAVLLADSIIPVKANVFDGQA